MALEMDVVSHSSEETPLVDPRDGLRASRESHKSTKQVIRSGSTDFYDDSPKDMTFSRRIAMALYRNPLYYPTSKRHQHGNSALDNAWAYFEHSTLARYELRAHHGHGHSNRDGSVLEYEDTDRFPRARAGEQCENTRLYPVIETPEADLADYGMGVGSYFFTLRMLALIMLAAGILSLPNILFFASDQYNVTPQTDLSWIGLRTSAVCTAQRWEACPTCTKDQLVSFPTTYERYAEATADDGSTILKFIRINECNVTRFVGMISCGTMVVVCIAIFALLVAARMKELEFDAAVQTTTDYSVEVVNPPSGAKNPEEWKTFFSQFGHVTSLTIAYDNEKLLAALTKRRALVKSLEHLQPAIVSIPHDISIEEAVNTALPVSAFRKLTGTLDAATLKLQIDEMDKKIEELSNQDFGVTHVFAIFETESAQQAALKALQVPGYKMWLQIMSGVPDHLLFEHKDKKRLLQVVEPCEPSGVRWKDLDEGYLIQFLQRGFTMLCTVVVILLGCSVVIWIRIKYGIVYAAIGVSVVTAVAPLALRALAALEAHPSESSKESSLFYKVTAFQWIATAMLTSIITPFVESLDSESDALIPAMFAIFISELITTPLINILDFEGNINRHVLAPRAKSAKEMIKYFQGTTYFLSERYTNMTSVLFLTCFYSQLFPAGYFFAAATLTVHYWSDKFLLLRTWAKQPTVGVEMAETCRQFFFTAALVVYALISSYYFALFPFDNACEESTIVPGNYVGKHTITNGENVTVNIEIETEDHVYHFCNQDLLRYDAPQFPAVPAKQHEGEEWMTDDQQFAYTYTYVSLTIAGFFTLAIVFAIWSRIRGFFLSPYRPHVEAYTPKNFSCIPDISAFIPQAKLVTDPFPILFCKIEHIADELIPWVDPAHSYDFHNAIYDVPGLSEKPAFSTVHYWPPVESNGNWDGDNGHNGNGHNHDIHGLSNGLN